VTQHAHAHARCDDRPATAFYVDVLTRLRRSGIPFLLGGGFAYEHYAGIDRRKKDLDIFLRRAELPDAFAAMNAVGYRTDLVFSHWLGKIRRGERFVDVIFGFGNGVAEVDDLWFRHGVDCEVLGVPVRLCPPEEMIWSKAFIQERERFDGADVLHLIRALGPSLDWARLLRRFGANWPLLFNSVVLFGFVYPDQRDRVPRWVRRELLERFSESHAEPWNRVCRGTLLSRSQYLPDLAQLGYDDARLMPNGAMTREQIETWTAAIDEPE
jgi:hypothetical protein